ncbi:hypothetical protein [Breoghania sp.]|uniref:hypothetical protein n=1 Tax=Breoghania sp. TaxID=2065378 RepID=UPI0026269279|nr:hypothetical protein [Breoghania sp.]MDJ0930357.1 hypothetical protein [Breoghania sp.]
MRRWFVLALFLIVTVGGGLAIGYVTAPGALSTLSGTWFASLAKPVGAPPN